MGLMLRIAELEKFVEEGIREAREGLAWYPYERRSCEYYGVRLEVLLSVKKILEGGENESSS